MLITYPILVASWFLLVEALTSIWYRGRKLKEDGWNLNDRRKLEYAGRIIRFGTTTYLLLNLLALTPGMLNNAGYIISAEASVAIALRLPELDTHRVTTKKKLEFTSRLIRGGIGLFYLVAGLIIS